MMSFIKPPALLLLIPSLLGAVWLTTKECYAEENLKTWPQYVGFDSFAYKVPVGPSKDLVNIALTGRHANYTNADTWYLSWASDGHLYSPWTDGSIGKEKCSSGKGKQARTGQARIIGDDPMDLQVISLGTTPGSALPYEGRYPAGSLVHDGVWYYGTYCLLHDRSLSMSWPILGPFVGFRISHDMGKTWDDGGVSPENNLFGEHTDRSSARPVKIGAPHFVDFGKNMEYTPDGYAYLVCHSANPDDPKPRPANLSWISGDHINLIRVKPSPETINDPTQYECFAGRDRQGNAIWSRNMDEMKPIFEWNNKAGCVTMTYNAPLKKYLMCITDGWPTNQSMDTYILESDQITGPWKMVTIMKDFGPQAYFVNIPSKFISDDGKRAWLCYSANFAYTRGKNALPGNPAGSHYALSLHEIVFLGNEK